jgi:hypothetical protein
MVEARITRQGQCSVRVAFDDPCPYDVFEAAVCGQHAADPKTRLAPAPRPTDATGGGDAEPVP